MRSIVRTVPLIGALLLSTAPVQAIETAEELLEACSATAENMNMCAGVAAEMGSTTALSLLCALRLDGQITQRYFDALKKGYLDHGDRNGISGIMYKHGIAEVQNAFPECQISP